jgi:hypothetical protein
MKELSERDRVWQSKVASLERKISPRRKASKGGTTSVLRRTDESEARRRSSFWNLDLRDRLPAVVNG